MWPKLSRSWIEGEVGNDCLDFLAFSFYVHLFGEAPRNDDIEYRLAPSIITRSECEILGLSAPRFAIRASFPNGSFVNLRRILRVSQWASLWEKPLANSPNVEYDEMSAKSESPGQILSEASRRCLADGLIIPPPQMESRFHLTTSNLLQAYGESIDIENRDAIPFVQSIRLGGGLCAQAVCFMATCVLSTYSKGIHGLGEISAIAAGLTESEHEDVIALGGLIAQDICNYLNSSFVSLSSVIESSFYCRSLLPDSRDREWFEQAIVGRCIAAYVQSGMPVVCLVDALKLKGFYRRHGIEIASNDPTVPSRHAMLITGSLKQAGWKDEFLVNDPSHLPLMKINIKELFEAKLTVQNHFMFIPVLPCEVRVNLLDGLFPEPSRGLLWLFTIVRKFCGASKGTLGLAKCFANGKNDAIALGEFLLLSRDDGNLQNVVSKHLVDSASDVQSVFGSDTWPRWVWVQHRRTDDGEAVNIWDATEPIDFNIRPNKSIDYLHASFFRTGKQDLWSKVFQSAEVKLTPNERLKSEIRLTAPDEFLVPKKPLVPSLISSFACCSLRRATALISKNQTLSPLRLIDIYAMMQSESVIPRGTSAEKALADMASDERLLDQVARKFKIALISARLQPSGFATFFPLISLQPSHPQAEQARRAIEATCRLAVRIQTDFSLDLVIEIVAGSRVHGLFPAKKWFLDDHSEDVVVAGIQGWGNAIGNLVKNLEMVIESVEDLSTCPKLALELEPGPLFTLNNESRLRYVADAIDSSSYLKDRVGLNLDICHYRMAGVTVDFVRQCQSVKRKILHAHISGHHPIGHFGDNAPLLINNPDDYEPWLQLLSELACDQYSGVLSLELEAAKSIQFLERAYQDLAALI